jgi:threonine/homoserine/homoserine lactone efflux protein
VESYWLFASIWFVAAATPGADTMLLLSTSLSTGWRSAIPISLGITSAKIILLIAAFFGLNAIIDSAPQVFVILEVFGCAFLLWRAFKLWNTAASATKNLRVGFLSNFTMAFTIAVSNPQALLFYVAVVPQVSQSTNILVLCAIIAIGFSAISACYILLANPIRAWVSNGKNVRLLNRFVAFVFVAIAAYLALRIG